MITVEAHAQTMHQRRPDRLGMAYDHDRALLPSELFDMSDYPVLKGPHALTAGRPHAAAFLVPGLPCFVGCKIGKTGGGPLPHVNLVERRYDLDGEATSGGDDAGRLQRPSLRAR